MTYYGAQAFITWFAVTNSVTARLPTSPEWEYVAKEPGERLYPWGNRGIRSDFPLEGPVGSRPDLATPHAVFDLVGPVYQWCTDDPPEQDLKSRQKIVRGFAVFRDGATKLTVPPNWKWFAAAKDEGPRHQGFRVVIENLR